MSDTIRGPEVRIRLKHTATAKGWRLDETTVEVSYTSDEESADITTSQFMQALMYSAHQDGLDEANRRNAQEGRGL